MTTTSAPSARPASTATAGPATIAAATAATAGPQSTAHTATAAASTTAPPGPAPRPAAWVATAATLAKATTFAPSPLPGYTRSHAHMGLADLADLATRHGWCVAATPSRPAVAAQLGIPADRKKQSTEQKQLLAHTMRLATIQVADVVLAAITVPGRMAEWQHRNAVEDHQERGRFCAIRSNSRDGTFNVAIPALRPGHRARGCPADRPSAP